MKMIGMARLGKDAEIRYTPGGDAVCNLSLSYVCGVKKQGEQYAPSQWIDATLWGKRAESLAQFLTKGSVHCFALSDVHIETYQGQNGPGHKLVGRVDDIELGPRVGDQPQQQQQAPRQQQNSAPSKPAGNASAPPDFDDSIPF